MAKHICGGMPVAEMRRGERGLTLIEVVMASGIFSVIALSTLFLYMTLVHSNNTTSMQVSATNLARTRAEDVVTAARENLSNAFGLGQAAAALQFFASQSGSELEGAGDRLVYYDPPIGANGRFGNSRILAEMGNAEGRVRVTMYLKEATVPAPPVTSGGTKAVWRNLGAGAASRASGFDMDRDGAVSDAGKPTIGTIGELKTLAGLQGLGIKQLPVDVEVAYFKPGDDNPAKSSPLYQTTRRIIIMDESTLTGLDMGMGLDPDVAEVPPEVPFVPIPQ